MNVSMRLSRACAFRAVSNLFVFLCSFLCFALSVIPKSVRRNLLWCVLFLGLWDLLLEPCLLTPNLCVSDNTQMALVQFTMAETCAAYDWWFPATSLCKVWHAPTN